MQTVTTLMELLGLVLVAAGVALGFGAAAALIVGGVELVAAGILLARQAATP